MRTRFRFLTTFLICSISIWLMIILYNIAKVDDRVDKWPAKVPLVAEPLIGLGHKRQSQSQTLRIQDPSQSSSQNDDLHSGFDNNYPDNLLNVESYDKSSMKKYPNEMQFPFNQMNQMDIIFYQFDMKTKSQPIVSTTSNTKHEQVAHQACFIRNEVDNYVQIQGDRLFAFNLLASNRLGFFRSLPDTRHRLCTVNKTKNTPTINQTSANEIDDLHEVLDQVKFPKTYPNNIKPKASVIICYFNEAPSALLRTIYTVIKRSPNELLHEIIVVDDFSDNDFHSNKIKPFVEEFGLISLHRTEKREGLIRARLFGAQLAKGEVLIFLDSHVEANEGWLEPLMSQIELDRTIVACPMIDLINPETMIYTSSPMVVGATSWSLHFKWISVASDKLTTQEDFIKPLDSPTMAGGLYAIDKEFFYHIGGYDSGMELWGGENVEISFRIWLCGGKVVVLSCSRVGHIFRKRRPYGPAPDKPDCLLYNSHRAARVWLDEYIEHFYKAEPGALNLDSGDVTDRLALKDKLKCKSFDWYIKNVYPQLDESSNKKHNDTTTTRFKPRLFKPNQKRVDRGIHRVPRHELNQTRLNQSLQLKPNNLQQANLTTTKRFKIRAEKSDLCIQARESPFTKGFFRLVLGNCNNSSANDMSKTILSDNQYWFKTEQSEFRLSDDQCLDLIKNLPLLRRCHNLGYFQTWNAGNGSRAVEIYNIKAGLCLAVERSRFGEPIIVTLCDKTIHNNHNIYNKPQDKIKSSHQMSWNKSEPFWNTGPDLIPQFAKLRFLNHDSAMPIIQRWDFIYEM